MLEPVGEERDGELPARLVREHLVGHDLAEPRRGEVAGLDHDVSALAHRREQGALLLDGGGDLASVGQWVPPARLLEAGDQHVLGGVEEQDAVCHAAPVELVEHAQHALEVRAPADVTDDRRALHLAPLVREQLGQRAEHLGWKVVHAEVARVLEAGHRLGLPGPGEAGDDHEVLDPLGRLGRGIAVTRAALADASQQSRPFAGRLHALFLPDLVDVLVNISCNLAGKARHRLELLARRLEEALGCAEVL